ncbi:hypothetical protein [Leptotrichia sp. oral taxon 879]|uniref:Uncharacterized protein n=1 Tax=Leptotrichia mesophila TaxID=3239303 RepID=A0AB39V9N1_9FUSO|nr:hypothetical protein [Leptotrichia sp. oral taxon 879]ERK50550.1 hypothetical protein HMPREF1552_01388 [Leptotrichia sp. oral taxon 879 str. F0557]
MKKIIILLVLLVTGISFSDTCKWIKNPNIYVTKEIELINKSHLKGNIYCDVEHDFMTYYVGIDNLEVGLVYNTYERKELTYENIFRILIDFENDIAKLIPKNIPKKDEPKKPRYYTFRLYTYDAAKKDTFMLFKYILDTKKIDGDWKTYYNNEIFSKTGEKMLKTLKDSGYSPTEDIMY